MIQNIQQYLTTIYALPQSIDIRNFLIDSEALLFYLNEKTLDSEISEKILFKFNQDGTIDVGLYFRKDILDRLDGIHPKELLNESNFSSFCSLIEGVSHFLFLNFRSYHTLPLSALELEVQAELDKFITSFIYQYHHHGQRKNPKCYADEIHSRLFQQYHLRTRLGEEEKNRYEFASQSAAKLCYQIKNYFLDYRPNWKGLLSYLRQFYRHGWNAKHFAIHSAVNFKQ